MEWLNISCPGMKDSLGGFPAIKESFRTGEYRNAMDRRSQADRKMDCDRIPVRRIETLMADRSKICNGVKRNAAALIMNSC